MDNEQELSPIHFHSYNRDEKAAYYAAYQKYLKYNNAKLGEFLQQALNGDARNLMIWHSQQG